MGFVCVSIRLLQLLLTGWLTGCFASPTLIRSASSSARLLLNDVQQGSSQVESLVITKSGSVETLHAGDNRVSEDPGSNSTIAAQNAVLSNTTLTESGLNCASKEAVWLLVLSGSSGPGTVEKKRFDMLTSAIPFCTVVLRPPHINFRNFWEVKQVVVRDYLLDHPAVKIIVVTDAFDVWANPCSHSELLSRFERLTKGKPRMVLATEPNCYMFGQCTPKAAQQSLDRIRLGQNRSDARHFVHSQYMGERPAVLDFLTAALGATPGVKGFPPKFHGSDQAMFAQALAENPRAVTLDFDDVIFASFFRGFEPVANGNFTCNFGGDTSMRCDVEQGWGNCTISPQGAVVAQEKRRTISPCVWHMNGPSRRAARRSYGCSEAFGDLPMGV